MKHEDTYAYSCARDYLLNDAALCEALGNKCKQLKELQYSDKSAINAITRMAIGLGWLGFTDGDGMPPISKRSIHYWAKEQWEEFIDFISKHA